jgi:hypothetical protein
MRKILHLYLTLILAHSMLGQGIQFNGNFINFLNGPNTMSVDLANRKVGINNSAPTFTLDVTGTINATGNIHVNGVPISPYTPPYFYASPWVFTSGISVDTTYDGTCYKLRKIIIPQLTNDVINTGSVLVYLKIGGVPPTLLPYISDAGGATNKIHWTMKNAGEIIVTRHTYKSCRFNSSVPAAYPTEPLMVNLPSSIEYRVVINNN